MRAPLEWLRELVRFELKACELAERLTMTGLEVSSIAEVAGDTVLDIKVSSNRPDCLSIVGIAREVAAILGGKLLVPEASVEETGPQARRHFRVEIEAPELCARYAARIIDGVRVRESPPWMARRLEQTGLRPINNVVDAANYVLMEMGHPLHAFDCDLLSGGCIVVRRAREGEVLRSLDGQERKLSREMLVIADGKRAVALAGVMGGQETEVHAGTRRVFLESAYFDPVCIRKTARSLGMQTEASYRFERGADIEGLRVALDRTARLVAELSGGKVAKGVLDNYPRKRKKRMIVLRPERVSGVLGAKIPQKNTLTILERLGFEIRGRRAGPTLRVEVPSHRRDVEREIDLVEEVARHFGYGRIPAAVPRVSVRARRPGPVRAAAGMARETLVACGLIETVNTSFIEAGAVRILGADSSGAEGPGQVKVLNPLSEGQEVIRPSLLPGLLDSVARNISRGTSDLGLFEVGCVFRGSEGGSVAETTNLAAVITGERGGSGWADERRQVDFYTLKGIAQAVLDRLRVRDAAFEKTRAPGAEEGRSARVTSRGKELGFAGEISRRLTSELEIAQPVFGFELVLDIAASLMEPAAFVRPVPRFPSSRRDIAIVVSEDLEAGEVERAIKAEGKDIVEDVQLFDVYRGEQTGAGLKSLAFAIRYRSHDRTLTDAEVASAHAGISGALVKLFGARIRTD